MKRFHFFLLIGVAAALAACQKQNVINEPAEKDGSYVFTLKATADVITKTDFDDEGTFSWTAGDAISVLFNNGTTNKFFTLTTEGSGASADFSGTIDAGYTIGALDDGTKWAFYPAGSHTYTSASDIKFNIPAVNDFTAEGYSGSANLPMYAQGDGNTFAFHYLTAGYKFTITDLDESISKIKFVVENNTTYELSSDIKLVIDGDNIYLKHDWGNEVERSLTYICKVNSKTATVYVPWRYNKSGGFQPTVTIYNADNDSKLKVISATNAAPGISEKGQVQPIRISCPGTGEEWSFTSAFGIDWTDSSIPSDEGSSSAGHDGIRKIKATADAEYIYLYFEVDKSKLLLDNIYEYANSVDVYLGNTESPNSSWMWSTGKYSVNPFAAWTTYYGEPKINSWEPVYGGTADEGGHAEEHLGYYYNEIRLKRSYDACISSPGTAYLGMTLYYQKYHGGNVGNSYMYAPASNMLEVTLP